MKYTIVIFNLAIYEAGWLISVLMHNHYAAIVVFALGVINLSYQKFFLQLLPICLLLATIGFLHDLFISFLGLFTIGATLIESIWLYSLWFIFISTFSCSLNFYKNLKLTWQALIGGFAGAISYFSGFKLGAISYNYGQAVTFVLHFIDWSILLPVLFKVHGKLLNRIQFRG